MSEQKHDQNEAFDAYLQGGHELSERYASLSAEHPSQKLDDAILAASRREVEAGPKSIPGGFYRKWKTPLSMAATVLLSVGLVSLYYRQSDEQMLREKDYLAVPAELPSAPPASTSVKPDVQQDLPSIAAQGLNRESDKDKNIRADSTSSDIEQLAAMASRETAKASSTRVESELPDEERLIRAPAVAALEQKPARMPGEKKQKREIQGRGLTTNPQSIAESDDLSALSATVLADGYSKETARQSAEEAQVSRRQAAAAQRRYRPATASRGDKDALQEAPAAVVHKYMRQSDAELESAAKKLLLRISRYRATGHFQQADRLLQRFHQRYPDFPASLRERILDSIAPVVR